MFCPSCGLRDTQSNQYCRACGVDLRTVHVALETPDRIAASAVSARDEIGRAIASKIHQTTTADELKKIAEKVLPQIEKFLESPQERKMRRVRAGSIVSFVGFGAALGFFLASIFGPDKDIIIMAAFGLVTTFIGLSLIVNGWFFTDPRRFLNKAAPFDEKTERELGSFDSTTNELLMPPTAQHGFSSVTEHTTRHLQDKKPVNKQ